MTAPVGVDPKHVPGGKCRFCKYCKWRIACYSIRYANKKRDIPLPEPELPRGAVRPVMGSGPKTVKVRKPARLVSQKAKDAAKLKIEYTFTPTPVDECGEPLGKRGWCDFKWPCKLHPGDPE